MEKYLDIVADWSEKNDIPFEIFRDHELEWNIFLRFKDSNGWFRSEALAVRYKDKRETDEEFQARVISRLASAVVETRRERTRHFTKRDPRRQQFDPGPVRTPQATLVP